TGSDDRMTRLWDVKSRKLIGVPLQQDGEVWGVEVSSDGRFLMTRCWDDAVRLWQMPSGNARSVLAHEHWVAAVAFSPDGKRFLTGTGDLEPASGALRLWQTATGQPLGQVISLPAPVPTVAFDREGTRLLSGCGNPFWGSGDARVWNATTGNPQGQPLLHGAIVMAVAFSPDGTKILSGSRDKFARLWEAASGKEVGSL